MLLLGCEVIGDNKISLLLLIGVTLVDNEELINPSGEMDESLVISNGCLVVMAFC